MTEGPADTDRLRLARRKLRPRKRLWLASVVAVALVVAGSLWLALSAGGAVSEGATLNDCSRAMSTPGSGPTGNASSLVPTVVGVGSSASIAVFDTDGRWCWCFDGVGVGEGAISSAAMRAPVAVPLVLLDGGFSHDVLVLVHHDPRTVMVLVDTVDSTSTVLARGRSFEVLRVPPGQAVGSLLRSWVVLGQVLGFDRKGLVTSSQTFTLCPGSIDSFPGQPGIEC